MEFLTSYNETAGPERSPALPSTDMSAILDPSPVIFSNLGGAITRPFVPAMEQPDAGTLSLLQLRLDPANFARNLVYAIHEIELIQEPSASISK